jgi:endonuclease-3 related protein
MIFDSKTRQKVRKLNQSLFRIYGSQGWWPTTKKPGEPPVYYPGREGRIVSNRDAFEIIIGSILTQNTSWSNAEKAIMNLSGTNMLEIKKVAKENPKILASAIIPARYYNQKSVRLKQIAENILNEGGIKTLRSIPTEPLRKLLLSWTGIGQETADSILCYAFSRDVFIVDAYTRRLFKKLNLPSESYEEIQTLVHQSIKASAAEYGDFHARIVKLFSSGDVKTFLI